MTAADYATVAVAFFALVELWRAGAQGKARTKGAIVKVSAVGYALRRQIRSWLAEYARANPRAPQDAQRGFDVAEARAQDMIATGVEATPAIQEAIREFYARFYRATGTINEDLAEPYYRTSSTPPARRRVNPTIDLEACVALLDRIVEPALQSVDDRLAAKLEAEQAASRSGST
jgi:hypothetical protein